MPLTSTAFAAAFAAALLVSPATAAATGPRTETEPLSTVKEQPIGGCEFPVLMTDRGGRTLTTTYEDGAIVRQTVTGSSVVELVNGVSGRRLPFEVRERAVYEFHADGTVTLTQSGDSGFAIDPGTVTGTPNLTWYAGRVRTVGSLDPTVKVPHFATVDEQSVVGLGGDVCEMLLTGLKSRH